MRPNSFTCHKVYCIIQIALIHCNRLLSFILCVDTYVCCVVFLYTSTSYSHDSLSNSCTNYLELSVYNTSLNVLQGNFFPTRFSVSYNSAFSGFSEFSIESLKAPFYSLISICFTPSMLSLLYRHLLTKPVTE